jgi:hypothetical protein
MANMPNDPFQYIGRLHRDENGRVKSMDVYYPGDEKIELDDDPAKNEFVTFVTVVEL